MLIVIEAPGKVAHLRSILRKIGFDGSVLATGGHIYRTPKSLYPVYINHNLEPTKLEWTHPEYVDHLVMSLGEAEEIIIATDPDSEGHLIATDVANLARKENPDIKISRMYMFGMDEHHVFDALNNTLEYDESRALPAMRRRSIDRLIAASMSDPDKKIFIGRVMAQTLNAMQHDEGMISEPVDTIMTGTEFMYHISRKMDVNPIKISEHMQKLYESGRMSYPRSDSQRVTAYASHHVADMYGAYVKPDEYIDDGAHPAPYPISKSDIDVPYEYMSGEDATLSAISRHWCRAGKGGPFIPMDGQHPESPEQKTMRYMMTNNVGRPGTTPHIANRIVEHYGLINKRGEINEKGIQFLRKGIPVVLDGIPEKISKWIDFGGNIQSVLEGSKLWDIVSENMNSEPCSKLGSAYEGEISFAM